MKSVAAGGNCFRHSMVRPAETGKSGSGASEPVPVEPAVALHARTARCDVYMGRQAVRSASSAAVGPRPPGPAGRTTGSDWTRTPSGLASPRAPASNEALVGEAESGLAVGSAVGSGGDASVALAASLQGAGGRLDGRLEADETWGGCAGYSKSGSYARRPCVVAWWPQWYRCIRFAD